MLPVASSVQGDDEDAGSAVDVVRGGVRTLLLGVGMSVVRRVGIRGTRAVLAAAS